MFYMDVSLILRAFGVYVVKAFAFDAYYATILNHMLTQGRVPGIRKGRSALLKGFSPVARVSWTLTSRTHLQKCNAHSALTTDVRFK